jgi:hypothetical protein
MILDPIPEVEVAMRIPARWSGPREMFERMPKDCRLTPEALILADGLKVELGFANADDQFAEIFRTSCRQEPTDEEWETINNYSVNVLLCGPGGSMARAHTMMKAAAAFIQAGAAGVFIDNSALAHGGEAWLAMTEDGGPDALSFAFCSIIRGDREVWTMGMHVLGLRDILMKRSDIEDDGFDIVEVIRYLARGDKPIGDGHIIADLDGPKFQAFFNEGKELPPGSPMHNPFGCLKLVSVKDISESN